MSWRVERARQELDALDAKCREAFQAGSERRDYTVTLLAWEYHRLHQLRLEARARLAHWERLEGAVPANDTTRPTGTH